MGKYKTILIDPPWKVEFIVLEIRPNQKKMPYPTMSIEEIKAMPIGELADEESNIFMWTTHTFLADSFDILKAWGFKYHCLLTWDKTNGRPHMGFKRRTEFVLYGYRGKIGVNQRGRFIPTLLTEEPPELFTETLTAHSRKHLTLYRWLERNAPEPRLEIFARAKRGGWDSWGNEVTCDVNIETVASISKEKQMSN